MSPIVGIGCSAGGIDALKSFFSAVRPGAGLGFVVVQHLDPDHTSILPELLGRSTSVPVQVIAEDTEVAAGRVYVIPPNKTLTIKNRRLHLDPQMTPREHRTPIDAFFTSLAEDQGESAACIILSGTGSDGTLGLRAIKEHGGLTLAQEGAEYDGMMRSAVATGLVDFVLPAREMATKLTEYFRHFDATGGKGAADAVRETPADLLDQICAILRVRTGHDFSGYKDKTIIRRVQRRMQVLQLPDTPTFLERLRKEPREVDILFHDLLIGVTNFFRDPNVFRALEENVIPRLFEGKGPEDTVRVWVAGCATGEEAYSIAILLRERAPKRHDVPKLQVFASDIDDHALELARTGRYPASIAKIVPADRLERYFVREDGTYRVSADLREICLFSVHNILRDAPFSKLDLISCRNLLIYLTPELQNRLVPLLHYALRDDGYLLLGNSENVARHGRLFATADKSHRIFRRRPRADRGLPEFPLTARSAQRGKGRQQPAPPVSISLNALAERHLLESYAPAYVIASGEGEVHFVSGRTGKYLELPAGMPSNNLFSMARRGLRLDLRAAFHKAVNSGQVARQGNVAIGTNGGRQTVDLIVHPIREPGGHDYAYMVIFQDVGGIKPATDAQPESHDDVEPATVRHLESELRATKERLQSTTEELESSNEELKSGNEELSSINEELQSANEELETSKEELQSINEELQTVNAELKVRVDELSRANSDIANLLESTQIATLFLDPMLAVKSFTPAAKEVFRLVESDAGRPISHVRSRLRLDTVEEDADRVLRTLATIEKQVESSDSDARYVMRMLPYRTVENVIAGVVITFIDVTRIAAAEARISQLTRDLRAQIASLETLLDLVPVGIFIQVADGTGRQQVRVNRHGARLVGEAEEQKGPRESFVRWRLLENGREVALPDQPLQRAFRTGQPVTDFEGRIVRADGSSIDVAMSAKPLSDENGGPCGAIAAIVDISQHKHAEAAQQVLLDELQHRVKNVLATVGSLATRMLKGNPSLPEFSSAFLSRLGAMGSMHGLLGQRRWEGADLRSLVVGALAGYADVGNGNLKLMGTHVVLKPTTAATLGLALHELATNAAKYGALSVPGGHVEASWRVESDGAGRRLRLAWTERDGPKVEPHPAEGFGTGFVIRSMEFELDGTATFAFNPEGLAVTLTMPLGEDDAANAEEATHDGSGTD